MVSCVQLLIQEFRILAQRQDEDDHHDEQRAAHFGNVQFIAVGTPPDEDGSADMKYVTAAARNIGKYMTDYKVVLDKSTVTCPLPAVPQ